MIRFTVSAMMAATLLCGAAAAADPLRAGAARRVVTPDLAKHGPVYMAGFGNNRVATSVHDDLYARCLALATGPRPLVICGVDVIGLFSDDVARMRARVDADLIVSALHDHEGPDTMGLWGPASGRTGINDSYMKMLTDQVAGCAQDAIRAMRPARIKLAEVRTPELDTFINDSRPPVVHDPEIVAMQASTPTGEPIATLINWANHPETLGSRNTLVTADYPAALYREAESLLGGVAVFINGAIGGMQSPLGAKIPDSGTGATLAENSFEKTEFIGARVARLAAGAIAGAKTFNIDAILFREKTIHIPMTNPGFQAAVKAGVFAGRKEPNPDGTTSVPVGYIRLSGGGAARLEVALIPGEMYPELSIGGVERYADADFPDAPAEPAIKKQMTAPFRMLFGLADDECGYIIPKAEWDEKAPYLNNNPKAWYGEVNSVGPEAAPRIAQAFRELMKQ